MSLSSNANVSRWVIILVSFIIITLILWNTYIFFQNFKAEERIKMQTWSVAQTDVLQNIDDLKADVNPVTSHVLTETNPKTPMLVINEDGSLGAYNNIDEHRITDSVYINRLITKFSNENAPIEIRYKKSLYQTLYYGNSPLLNKLKYYPLALLLIILLFGAVVYFFYRSTKNAEQNKLWTGMAKETAHQIGTPLSSLVGWVEILKSENTNPNYITEIEKDIDRLHTITDRFSKIGSVPTLEKADLVQETLLSYDYLKSRSSNLITFEMVAVNKALFVNLNKQLYSWTIENLVKNAIDAMKGKGTLKIEIIDDTKYVRINITDSGKGLPKSLYNKIFEPGYTSKKRGWGLGLSLAKRIVEDYHSGQIKVLKSDIGKGTTMQISLKVIS